MAMGFGDHTSFDHPLLNSEVRSELLRGILNQGIGQTIRIMVIGETGQGKSTLVNAVLGNSKDKAEVGHSVAASGTSKFQKYTYSEHGVDVIIWDSPGFGANDIQSDDVFERLNQNDLQSIDLTFFCIRMDQARIPTRREAETIEQLTKMFGQNYWKRCLFVLTFANMVEGMDRVDERPLEDFFKTKLNDIEESLHTTLERSAGIEFANNHTLRVAPVGSSRQKGNCHNPWALPDRQDWFIDLWREIVACIDPANSVLPGLLQFNCHRLKDPPFCVDSAQVAAIRIPLVTTDQHIQGEPSNPVHHPSPSPEQLIPAEKNLQLSAIIRTEFTQQRNIPWHEMLLQDLQIKDSFVHKYILEFAKGKYKHEQPGGYELYLKGAVDGLKAWLKAIKYKIFDAQEKHSCFSTVP